jgi:hypothetical protein
MYELCGRYTRKNKFLCKVLANSRGWLHDDNGLSLKKYIDEKIKKLSEKVNYNKEYQKGLEILYNLGVGKTEKTRRIHKTKYGYFLPKLKEVYLVRDENGNWLPINKLNTSYHDLAEILTETFIRSRESFEMYNYIKKYGVKNFKKYLKSIKRSIYEKMDEHFIEPEELHDFTKNIKPSSIKGEESENYVKEVLTKKGFKLLYQGGDGDLIDMIYGIDLIMLRNNKTYLIQVKSSEKRLKEVINDSYYKWINLFIAPTKDGNIKIIEGENEHIMDSDGNILNSKKND